MWEAGMGSKRVALVVDDDESVRWTVAEMLGRKWTIVQASSVGEAITALKKGGIDLLITDYHLGKEFGTDIIRDAVQRQAGIPVILMTGFGSEGVAINAFHAGAFRYIRKPFTLLQLRQLIAEVDRWIADNETKKNELIVEAAQALILASSSMIRKHSKD